MKLDEILTTPYKYALEFNDNRGSVWFSTDNRDVVKVALDYRIIRDREREYSAAEIVFSRNGRTKMTGEGDAPRIFATVLAITKEYVSKKKPDLIFFSSNKSDESRTKFYQALIKRFSSIIGYQHKDLSETHPKLSEFIKREQGDYFTEQVMYIVRKDLK